MFLFQFRNIVDRIAKGEQPGQTVDMQFTFSFYLAAGSNN